jgi:hypothetical protein
MRVGSDEHKAQFVEDTLKQFQESIWRDEMNLVWLGEQKAEQERQLIEIDGKMERKEYESAGVGRQLKFVVDKELGEINELIAQIQGKVSIEWPKQMEKVQEWAKAERIELE